MTDQHPVPPTAGENVERIQQRPYESDFARLPASEAHTRTGPGGGPQGTVTTGGSNVALAVVAVGALLAFAVFVVPSPWLFGIGVLLILGGGIWAGVRAPRAGAGQGSGRTDVPGTILAPPESDHPERSPHME